MTGRARHRRDPEISRAARDIRNTARGLHERLNVALIRWGRAKTALDAGGDSAVEFRDAERELFEIYQEFDVKPVSETDARR